MTTNLAPVLAISLANQSWFDKMYGPVIAGIKSRTELQQTSDAASALRLLSQVPAPSTVLITDHALALKENATVWNAVLKYVRGGGTAVIMGSFSSFVLPNEIEPFFGQAGLRWWAGPYHRSVLTLNESVAVALGVDAEKLLPRYSQKALLMATKATRAMLYVPDKTAPSMSRAALPGNCETAVAMERVGDGRIGYIGDVNAEDGSQRVILAMCGLL
ncbi:transcription factor [Cordyceps militaris]|uniref:Transcription factor n=1 Tax=Cordyceps militaris TaxID=73501 RepID=A0A2H4SB71_CORMI|nr:transcription factor [Cordyceps militaris]